MTLLLVALAWCCGVVAAALGMTPWWPLIGLAGTAFAAGCLLGRRPRDALLAVAFAAVAVAGVLRYDSSLPAPEPAGVARLNGSDEVLLRGLVVEEPERRERTQRIRLEVESYQDEAGAWVATTGRVLITSRPFPEFGYGDRLELQGSLETPPRLEGFDYRAYLERQGVGSISLFPVLSRTGSGGGNELQRRLNSVRDELAEGIEASLPEPEASLAEGLLLGRRSAIPADVTEDFNRSGLSHLLAISGYNVMLVATFSASLLWPLIGRRRALVVSMLVVLAYAALVGGSPSVLRATAMGLILLGAQLSGRPGRSLRFLVLAVAVLLAEDPRLVDDVSFQLSVFATGGIVLFTARLQELIASLAGRLIPAPIATFTGEQLALTLAASIAVLPVMAMTFGRVSLVALVTNLAAVPAFAVMLLASLTAALAGALDAEAGRLVGEVAYLPLAYLVLVARLGANLPGATISLSATEGVLLTLMLAPLVAAVLGRRRPLPASPARFRPRPALAATAVLAVLAVFVWWEALTPADDRLRVSVLDVGDGDAILIETPAGRRILVDGGPSGSRLLQQLGETLPAGERRIDLVALTHPQEDHVGGLPELLDRYDVVVALSGRETSRIGAYQAWREGLAEEGLVLLPAAAGAWADLGDGVILEVLGPPEQGVKGGSDPLNEASVVLRLVYGEVSFLLTGDLGFAGEAALLDSGAELRSTVLKVGHHGSEGSTSTTFLDAVSPSFAVISVGDENIFGHPSPTTRLRLAGLPILRTDRNGRVTFKTDGRRLWLEFERGRAELVRLP